MSKEQQLRFAVLLGENATNTATGHFPIPPENIASLALARDSSQTTSAGEYDGSVHTPCSPDFIRLTNRELSLGNVQQDLFDDNAIIMLERAEERYLIRAGSLSKDSQEEVLDRGWAIIHPVPEEHRSLPISELIDIYDKLSINLPISFRIDLAEPSFNPLSKKEDDDDEDDSTFDRKTSGSSYYVSGSSTSSKEGNDNSNGISSTSGGTLEAAAYNLEIAILGAFALGTIAIGINGIEYSNFYFNHDNLLLDMLI